MADIGPIWEQTSFDPTGHSLAFPYVHMLPNIVSLIDRRKAIDYLKERYGWPERDTIAQVLTPLSGSALIATAAPDRQSIVCYPLRAEIMKDGAAVPGGGDINASDGQFAARAYPKSSDVV
ncbi:uncharacterized protein A1O5_08272 [Cladophialophora psammophila CBS 110553]|uniref:Uncharacterized protein n=1 Tax=Cladophialophora psammophila CBS 110553 TaxID=1182543 RepID=W9XDI7_9EURO|nr:uncharacterized protein A1O5_08272 [Cladophialophora psammophila CBS 110553]EXJ68479.1 hypothetical protein A1O5_08272 [Cladophialophora psammophila CBS 110553]